MPTYPYACTECGHAFEIHQSFTDPSLTECPECSGRLRKVFSSVGVVFKGTGFYRNDSRAGSVPAGSTAGSGSGSSDGGSGGSAAGGDAKPATKSDGATTAAPATTSAKPAPAAAAGS